MCYINLRLTFDIVIVIETSLFFVKIVLDGCVAVGMLQLRRHLSLQHPHFTLTVMALSDSGLVSDPHATVDITVYDASLTDTSTGLRHPEFTQRLYQMNISEDALSGASVGAVSVTWRKYHLMRNLKPAKILEIELFVNFVTRKVMTKFCL